MVFIYTSVVRLGDKYNSDNKQTTPYWPDVRNFKIKILCGQKQRIVSIKIIHCKIIDCEMLNTIKDAGFSD